MVSFGRIEIIFRRKIPQLFIIHHSFFTIHSLIYGAALVSTGIVRLDKRAEAPDLYKMGNFFKLTDNDNFVLAAA